MSASIHDIPGTFTSHVPLRAHAAATATELATVFVAPFPCKLTGISVYFDAAATGDDTNSTHVNAINAGTGGAGTTEIGAKDYATGTDVVAGVEQAVYAPAAGSELALAAGSVIKLQLEKIGTGLALGNGLVVVEYQGN